MLQVGGKTAIIGAKTCKGSVEATYATMTTKVTVHVYDMVSV